MSTMRNKVQLIGHLGMNPEIRTGGKGTKIAKIRMATNDVYINGQGERTSETVWHNVIAFGKLAEIAGQLLQKGSEVVIDGKMSHHEYVDKNGTKRVYTDIIANNLLVLERKQNA